MDFSLFLAMAPMDGLEDGVAHAMLCCPFEKDGTPPASIPPGALPVFTDSCAYNGQSPERLAKQWLDTAKGAPGILLDFQRPGQIGLTDFVQSLQSLLPCPVVPPPEYAGETGPVFLPPIPPDCLPEDYLAPWACREVWLDVAPSGKILTLCPSGCSAEERASPGDPALRDEALCCHYSIRMEENAVRFCLWRTGQDLFRLTEKAKQLGVSHFVGLYPELTACGFLKGQSLPGSGR